MLRFTAARQKLIAENIVNVRTPGYRQKDLSVEKFQQMLPRRVESAGIAGPGAVRFDDICRKSKTRRTASCSTTATTGRWNN